LALGGRVLGGVEERAVVGAPLHRGDALGAVGQQPAGAEVLDVQPELAVAGRVGGVGEQVAVVADREGSERKELQAAGQLVQVEEDFLRRRLGERAVAGRLLAALDGVLLAFDRAGVVEVRAAAGGDAQVGLLDAAEHLPVEGVGERPEAPGHRLGVGVFRLQVADHLGVALVAQPEVGVVDLFPVPDGDVLHLPGHRGRGRRLGPQPGRGGERGDAQGEKTKCDTPHKAGP
jgi:hypothetical protein